ncbi:Predicted arabinose efflux permease, MFS family [Flexibacter flexilis DSM 6793]|uniref:Predicted arabinose efflux permease, MFS family n=1 Tax=Flexibacter flexilis DSM 6793 TaxID=927664 RepID=A0A1I1DBC6_9BACT|nr:MFS transporter [Flexibacter flexilis]SFB72084.1 Predicted arabinose efflux permease, MFS family [Flexibacter flexilis DSM 6793]
MKSIYTLYKNAFSGLPRNIWLLAFIMLINRSGTMVLPFMSVYLTHHLHFSVVQSGIILSLFGAGSVVGALIGGKLSDSWGCKQVQLGSLVLGGMLFLVLVLAKTFEAVAVMVVITAIASEALRPANAASVANFCTPETRTRAYSLSRLSNNLGFALGPTLGGIMAHYSYEWLFVADGLTCISAGILLQIFLPKVPPTHAHDTLHVADQKEFKRKNSPYRDTFFVVFVVLVSLYATGFFQFFSTLPLHYKLNCGLDEFSIGLLMSLNGVVIVLVEMVVVYKLQHKSEPTRIIMVGVGLMLLSYLILAVEAQALWAIVAYVLIISFSEILAMPFMSSFVVERSRPSTRGQYMALYTVAYSVAHIISPILGTQLVEWVGFAMLWNVLIVFSLVTLMGFVMLNAFQRKHQIVGNEASV